MKKTIAVFAFAALLPALVAAQSVTSTVIWDYAAATLTEVNGYAKGVVIDGTPVAGTPTCVQIGPRVECRLTTAAPLSSAPHDVVITYEQNGVQKELRRTIDISKGPKDASAPRVTITTVTVGP